MKPFGRAFAVFLALAAHPASLLAQPVRAVVVDQTGLPMPGVLVQLVDHGAVVATFTTESDGRFSIDAALPGDSIVASFEGFETIRVARSDMERIVLPLGRTFGETGVVAAAMTPSSPTAPLIGNRLAPSTILRLPSTHMSVRESLPLLPSVVRGPDGLLQIAGSRGYDTPVMLDGFNLTDPATGLSSFNLPFEAVRGVEVIRDPMAVSYGGLIGGLVKIDSQSGGDRMVKGVQGFVPRPRVRSPGFGRIDGIFPRTYVGGSTTTGRIRAFAAAEYDYEHVPVPTVSDGSGPDILEKTAVMFTRFDINLSNRHHLTAEALASPASTQSSGLSTRRASSATANVTGRDLFAGITHRMRLGQSSVMTTQVGVLSHDAAVVPNGSGPSILTSTGWRGNWFSAVDRTATRYSGSVAWQWLVAEHGRTHDVTVGGEVASRALAGRVAEGAVLVNNAAGRKVRTVDSSAAKTFSVSDNPLAVTLRDVWHAHDQFQLDGGLRLDHSRYGGRAPSARLGVRYAIDRSSVTVIKAGYGTFIGTLPLSVPAFAGYPTRTDRTFDPGSGRVLRQTLMTPAVANLRLPRAVTTTLSVEQQIRPGFDALIALTNRRVSRVATLHVPRVSGPLLVDSTGEGLYRDAQVVVRRTWPNDQQLFVSYVRSSLEGELNAFAAVFQSLDAPLLQPGGMSRLVTDAPHRLLAWGTFNLPRQVIVSPMVEWRSGFRFSALDPWYEYDSIANGDSFPAFFTLDMIVYKTVVIRRRAADVGFQLFNATNHTNPRDVQPVVDGAPPADFDNSVGRTFRGYMRLRW